MSLVLWLLIFFLASVTELYTIMLREGSANSLATCLAVVARCVTARRAVLVVLALLVHAAESSLQCLEAARGRSSSRRRGANVAGRVRLCGLQTASERRLDGGATVSSAAEAALVAAAAVAVVAVAAVPTAEVGARSAIRRLPAVELVVRVAVLAALIPRLL
jgi:hypothetical protein